MEQGPFRVEKLHRPSPRKTTFAVFRACGLRAQTPLGGEDMDVLSGTGPRDPLDTTGIERSSIHGSSGCRPLGNIARNLSLKTRRALRAKSASSRGEPPEIRRNHLKSGKVGWRGIPTYVQRVPELELMTTFVCHLISVQRYLFKDMIPALERERTDLGCQAVA